MKSDYILLYRDTVIDSFVKDGYSVNQAIEQYKEQAKSLSLMQKSNDELKDLIVDKLLYSNNLDWNEIKHRYFSLAKDYQRACHVVSEIGSMVSQRAYEDALNGNWSTHNDQFLTFEQRDNVAIREAALAEA